MASPKMSLKLLLDKKGQRVLFAETNKEFVDFLFHMFSLPLGTLIEILGSKQMVGCLGKLKESIDSFSETYLQPGLKKDDIFNPKTPFNRNTFLLGYESPTTDHKCDASKEIFRCSFASSQGGGSPFFSQPSIHHHTACCDNVTLYEGTKCPNCKGLMNVKMTRVMHENEEHDETEPYAIKKMKKGYVQEVMTYMVMDDLVIKPMSTISSITLVSKFGVKDLSQLEEKTVSFGQEEGLKLLKASLMTEKVLTSIYMQ